ncbi:MAG: Ni2+-binding GTPase involved in maturation of urease and hydrogenase [Chlamydiales bacterium]|jgi:Ni2+-binding GTPase involved in maturation of urease and hydrogenase
MNASKNHATAADTRARYVMIGGFLGAGKTTAVGRFAAHLTASGLSAGLITNDQSTGLVDSSILRSQGFEVEEIGGGCFCCRFDTLSDAVGKLTERTRPDVFVAEPVGSCTDLMATVSYPLRRIYGDRFAIAPLSVLVDPKRAARILGLESGRSFSAKVVYVYEKQLEEADIIVINKCETRAPDALERLSDALRSRFPRADVLQVSAKEGIGLDSWFERILSGEGCVQPTMDVDYDTYAEGEALLGWLNSTVAIAPSAEFDANALLRELCDGIRDRVLAAGAEIAHLKMTLDAGHEDGQLAAISMVTSEGDADVRESLLDRVTGGSLIINLRAEADPDVLAEASREVLAECMTRHGLDWGVEHSEHFRPGRPVPVHRDVISVGEGDA